jgi:eukaryotic-like serine/threonine-protein kinase
MSAVTAKRSTCSACGSTVDESSDLGCIACWLRAGLAEEIQTGNEIAAAVDHRFGPFLIERREDGSLYELGRGAMGVTYLATDSSLRRKVALKITGVSSRSAETRERFMRGARAAAALRHENVATVYHFGIQEETGQCFYAMELVEGETLEERVRRTGPLDVRSTIAIARQVADALAAAEKCGLVHRDLKPANLMLVESSDESFGPKVKVIDFGLAKAIKGDSDPMWLTRDGFVGTPAFASPEQFAHAPLDVRSDIYSLGVTLWFALTGKTPFAGRNVDEIRAAQASGALPLEQLKAARVPKRLMSILESMLALEAATRPSVRDLATRLRQCTKRFPTARQITVGALIAAIVIAAVVAYSKRESAPSLTSKTDKSLAIIPFTNASRDPDAAFFVYGIRAGITSRLSKISDLRLVTNNTQNNHDDSPEAVKELASTLGVSMVLQGSMEKTGDRFRINVRLTNVKDDVNLWSETYERNFSGIVDVERDVAQRAAASLGLKLTEPQRRAILTSATNNPRAYEAYLKGREVWLQRTTDAYEQAKEYFEEAIALDPNYASAYAGLADAYQFLGGFDFSHEHRDDNYAKAKKACDRALELDPQLGEAHATRGLIAMNYDWDWVVAEQELKRAIDLDPNNALIHDWYAELERTTGRTEASVYEIVMARDLDPLSPLINSDTGKLLYFARRYDEAIAQLRNTIRMNPSFDQPHLWLGYTLVATGKFDGAVQEFKSVWKLGHDAWEMGLMAYAYGMAGRRDEARRLRESIEREFNRGITADQLPLVLACIGAGDNDCALRYLEQDYVAHSTTISGLKTAPYFDPLRSDPRFVDLMRRVHLAP